MNINKTGNTVLKRFQLPKQGINLALVRAENGTLGLYKNFKIPGTELDSFRKVAEKEEIILSKSNFGIRKLITRSQFDPKGEKIGLLQVEIFKSTNEKSKVNKSINRITHCYDKSISMKDGISITNNGKGKSEVKLVQPYTRSINEDEFTINFKPELSPMAKRILKLLNQAINK